MVGYLLTSDYRLPGSRGPAWRNVLQPKTGSLLNLVISIFVMAVLSALSLTTIASKGMPTHARTCAGS